MTSLNILKQVNDKIKTKTQKPKIEFKRITTKEQKKVRVELNTGSSNIPTKFVALMDTISTSFDDSIQPKGLVVTRSRRR